MPFEPRSGASRSATTRTSRRAGLGLTSVTALTAVLMLAGIALLGVGWSIAGARAGQAAASPAPGKEPGVPPASTRLLKVRFLWDAGTEPDLAGHVVSWGDAPGKYSQTKALGRDATSVELDLPVRPEPYYVAVQARNAAGELSGYSNEFTLDVSAGFAKAWKPARQRAPKARREKPAKAKKEKKPKKDKKKAREAPAKPTPP